MRKIKLAVACLALATVSQKGHTALVFSNWVGASGGNWNVAANWDPAVIPNNGTGGNTYHVSIDNGNLANSLVFLNISPTIDALTISAGDTLSMGNAIDLEIAVGPIANDGLLSLNSTGVSTELEIAASMSLTGSGVLLMSNNGQNFIDNNDSATIPVLTHGLNHTIRGAGQIIDVTLMNDGLIDANLALPLTVDLVATNTNAGTLQSSASGTLNITGTILTNTDGIIQALDTSTVNLATSSILGGLLHADAGSAISGTTSTLQNITLTGLLRQDNGEDLVYEGTITNNGTIALNSTGVSSEIEIHPNGVMLTGTGEVVMSNNTQNYIDDTDDGGAANPLVHGIDHTIRGAGQIIDISLANDGLINANLATPLVIDLVDTNTNTGTLQSSASGTLNITGTILNNTDGVIQALDTSTVNLASSSILGGVLHADPTSAISGTTSTLQDITLTGLLRQDNGEDLVYEGTIANNGTIALNSTGVSSEMQIHANGVTLTGTGEVVMSNNTQNYIDDTDDGGPPNHLVHDVDHTIRGGGQIGFSEISLTNDGLIRADQPTKLVIDLADTTNINNGVLQAVGTSTLELNGTVITSTDGVIQALETSTVDIISSTVIGGQLHADPGSAFSGTTSTLQDITLTGLLRHDNNDDLVYRGTITNNGTIALNSTGVSTEIEVPSDGVTFAGTGEIVLGNNAQNLIDDTDDGGAANPLVNGPDHTIRGAGNVGTDGLLIINQGSIIADGALGMTVDPQTSFDNEGLLAVVGSGSMSILAAPFTNTGQVQIDATRTLTRTGNFVQTAGTTTVNGTLALISAGVLNLQGGVLNGSGTITGPVNNSGGSVQPGNSAGILAITGAYSQGHSGKLRIEIGGPTAGTQHDRLTVTAAASLAGTIEVAIINKYRPVAGETFTVLTAGTLNGQFRAVDAPNGLGVVYQGNTVLVKVVQTPCAADVTFDSLVNVNDLLAVINGWGPCTNNPCPPSCVADVTNDCNVNVNDLLAVINAWGACPQ